MVKVVVYYDRTAFNFKETNSDGVKAGKRITMRATNTAFSDKHQYDLDPGLVLKDHVTRLAHFLKVTEEHFNYCLQMRDGQYLEPGDDLVKIMKDIKEGSILYLKIKPSVRAQRAVKLLDMLSSSNDRNKIKETMFLMRYEFKDATFAEDFFERGGMSSLFKVLGTSVGAGQAYALTALRVAMTYLSGMETLIGDPALILQLLLLLNSAVVAVVRQTLELLFVICNFNENGWELLDDVIQTNSAKTKGKPYSILFKLVDSGDLDTQLNCITLLSSILSTCTDAKRKAFISDWRALGIEAKLRAIAKVNKQDFVKTQLQIYQRKMLEADPMAQPLIPTSRPASSPPSTLTANAVEGSSTSSAKEPRPKSTMPKEKSKAAYATMPPQDKIRILEAQQPLIRIMRQKLRAQDTAITEANKSGAFIDASAPLKRYIDRKDDFTSGNIPVDLSRDVGEMDATSSTEVCALKEKTQALAEQVSKLKEVGQALMTRKDNQVKSLESRVEELKGELALRDSPTNNDTARLNKEITRLTSELAKANKEIANAAAKQNNSAADDTELFGDVQLLKDQILKLQKLKDEVVREVKSVKKRTAIPGVATAASGLDTLQLKQVQDELALLKATMQTKDEENEQLREKLAKVRTSEEFADMEKRLAALEEQRTAVTKENTALRVKLLEAKMTLKDRKSTASASGTQSNGTSAPASSPSSTASAIELAKREQELEIERDAKDKALQQLKTMMQVMKVLKSKYDAESQRSAQLEALQQTTAAESAQLAKENQELKTKRSVETSPLLLSSDVHPLPTNSQGHQHLPNVVNTTTTTTTTSTTPGDEDEEEEHHQHNISQESDLRDALDITEEELANANEEIAHLKKQSGQLEAERDALQAENERIKEKWEESKEHEETSTAAVLSLNNEVQRLTQRVTELQQQVNAGKGASVQDLEATVAQLQREKRSLQENFGKELLALQQQTKKVYGAEISRLKEEIFKLQDEKRTLVTTSTSRLKTLENLLQILKTQKEGTAAANGAEGGDADALGLLGPNQFATTGDATPLRTQLRQSKELLTPSKPAIETTRRMKNLYWTRILVAKDTTSETSYWKSVKEADFDRSEFESKFSSKPAGTYPRNSVSGAARVLSPKRSQAVAIMQSSLPANDALQKAILMLDNDALSRQQVQNLFANLPSDEECQLIGEAVEVQRVEVDEPEKFLLSLMSIPFLPERLQCWLFVRGLYEKVGEIEPPLVSVRISCTEVRSSGALNRLFGIVLALGNYMNANSETRGRADGFRLEGLRKLSVRDNSNKTTLLEWVSGFVKKNEADLTQRLADELEHIAAGAKVSLEEVGEELGRLAKEYKSVQGKARKISDAPFSEIIPKHLNEIGQQITELQKTFFETTAAFRDLVAFFGYAPSDTISPEEFFGELNEFVVAIQQRTDARHRHPRGSRLSGFSSASAESDPMASIIAAIRKGQLPQT